jgi:hypothetical protein
MMGRATIATLAFLLATINPTLAATPLDGDWSGGTGEGSGVGCSGWNFTAKIVDGVLTGQGERAKGSLRPTLSGTIGADGSFKGKLTFDRGALPVVGQAGGDVLKAKFKSSYCEYEMTLQKSK